MRSSAASSAVEVYLRKPLVLDFGNIRKDTVHWSGWRRNRGADFHLDSGRIGTYIGGFHIYDSL